jgi:PIN domain nuclease of toxin-antitoxin system
MRILLDTHVVLWLACNSPKLSGTARELIFNQAAEKFVGMVSVWEFAIKCSLGKLEIAGGLSEFYRMIGSNGFHLLPILRRHVGGVVDLPFHHRDPFDRLLVATAIAEGMELLTADENIHRYDVKWAW